MKNHWLKKSKSFQIGDVVKLKSDDKQMTVQSFDPVTFLVYCGWFESDSVYVQDLFLAEDLIKCYKIR